mmetsp:Transcript_1132/g.4345  ORF Transcript_1132/g.4345 Transcript_1132/m.4345 type:complete len:238 (-) Transcript_1132:357-1070(-)
MRAIDTLDAGKNHIRIAFFTTGPKFDWDTRFELDRGPRPSHRRKNDSLLRRKLLVPNRSDGPRCLGFLFHVIVIRNVCGLNDLDGVVLPGIFIFVVVIHVDGREHLLCNLLVTLAPESLEHITDARDGRLCISDRVCSLVESLADRPRVLLSLRGGFLYAREPIREGIPAGLDNLVPRQVRVSERDDVADAQLEHLSSRYRSPVNIRPVRRSHVGDVNLAVLSSFELCVLRRDRADA